MSTETSPKELKNLNVFLSHETYWGIPTGLFVNILVFSIGIGVIIHSILFTVIFFLLSAIPMHYVHKSDPHAYKIWLKNLFQPHNHWEAGSGPSTKRQLIIIDKESK